MRERPRPNRHPEPHHARSPPFPPVRDHARPRCRARHPARRHRGRRRRRAVPRAAPGGIARLRRRPPAQRHLRRRRGLRPARRQRRDRRLRPRDRDLRGGAEARGRDGAPRGRRRGRHARGAAEADQPAPLYRPRPVRRRRVRRQGRHAARDRRLAARPRPARRPGDGEPRRLDAGGRDPAPGGRARRRGAADGAAQHLGDRRGERPARIGLGRRRRPVRPVAADGDRTLEVGRPRGAPDRRGQPAGGAGAGGGHGCRARPRLARHPAARGDRPRARGRLQPQEDLGLRRADGPADRGAGRDRGRRRHHPRPPRLDQLRRRGHAAPAARC